MKRIIKRITYNDFRGGKVQKNPVAFGTDDPEGTMLVNQMIEARNVALWPDGTVSLRSGFRKVLQHPANRAIVSLCLVPGTDSVAVVDTYESTGTKYDIKVAHVSWGTLSLGTWASPASGVNIGMTSMRPPMVTYNGKVYIATHYGGGLGGGIREITVTAGSEGVGAGYGPLVPMMLCVHNERLVTVDYLTPNVVQMSATGAPTDFTNGVSFAVGQCRTIVGIASVDSDLYIFTDSGIFVLSGFTEDEMRVQRLEVPYSCSGYATTRFFTSGNLTGFGPCVFFLDQAYTPCAVSRRGMVKLVDGHFSKTNWGVGTGFEAAYLDDTKQLIMFCSSWDTISSVFGNVPYKGQGGTKWGLVDYDLPPETGRNFPAAITSGFLVQSFVSQNKPVVLIGWDNGAIYLHTQYGQEDYYDSGYSGDALDDSVYPTGFYEPQGKITMRLEHGGNGGVKRWSRVLIKANKASASPAFSAYFHLGNPIAETVTVASVPGGTDMTFDIGKHSQYCAVGFNLFRSSSVSLSQILRQCIIRAIIVEFEVDE